MVDSNLSNIEVKYLEFPELFKLTTILSIPLIFFVSVFYFAFDLKVITASSQLETEIFIC